ncbi:uncharacterized protein BX663DRAFT_500876 [Cokeromyces recurvatus]|uniref:uncharacterized protein n=1 Tax=Cokeromyces recurvatus TaxID=90255 RepID=UPI002220E592|nr:uncharacterized protein BX663DRAFT_500876 [Cokeromyces recurvatus]KAI7905777.1 hypothetical protein BX663DRAFT_500876 [Cokeromyces recurvatus]
MSQLFSASIGSAIGLTSVACLSSIAISIQRRFYHDTSSTQFGKDPSPLKYDHVRDYTVPFSDENRLIRILFNTLVMTIMSFYDLYNSVSQFSQNKVDSDTATLNIISKSLVCISWMYALTLTVISRRYKLPNKWGFILNIHLFVYYTTSLIVSLYSLWEVFILRHESHLSLAEGLPLILATLFSFDLFYTTGSAEQGPPFLDVHGDNEEKEGEPAPVVGVTVASIFSFLYFNWGTPVVMSVYRNAKEIHLPSLPPDYRGYNLFYLFGEERGRSLVYRLIHANLLAILFQSITTAISASLYYAPAFFLNKLLELIQAIDAGRPIDFYFVKGLLIVSGLSLSLMILSIVVGQVYYWSSSSLRIRVKAMLNIELYRKTLRRVCSADINREMKDDEKGKGKGKENNDKKAIHSTATTTNTDDNNQSNSVGTIVNLMSTDSQRISDFTTSWFVIIEAPIELIVGISFLYSLLGSSCLLGLCVMIITLPLNHYNSIMLARTQEKLMEARDKRVSLMNEVLQGIRQIKFFAWETNWEKHILEARDVEIKHLKTTFVSEVLFNFLWQGTPLLVTIVSFFTFTKLQGQVLTAPIAFTAITVFTELRSALNSLPETFVDILQALISVRRIESYLNEDEVSPPTTNLDPNCRVHIGFRNATVAWSELPNSLSDDESTTTGTSANNNLLSQPSLNSTTTSSTTNMMNSLEEPDTIFMLHDLNCHFPNGQLSIISGATGSGKTLMMLSLLGETTLIKGESFCPRAPIAEDLDSKLDQVPRNITRKDWILDHAVAYVSQTAWLQNATIRENILFGLPYMEKRYKETLYACALHKDLEILEDGDATEIGEKGITLSGGQRARVALARAVYSRAKNVLMDDILSAVDAHTARHLHDKCLVGPLMVGRTRILITHHVGLCISEASYIVHLENGRIHLCGSPEELEAEGVLNLILDDVVAPAEDEQKETIEKEIEMIDPDVTIHTVMADSKKADHSSPRVLVKEETRAIGRVKTRMYKTYLKALGGPLFWVIVCGVILGSRSLDVAESWWIKKWVHSNESNMTASNASFFKRVQYTFMGQQLSTITGSTLIDNEGGSLEFIPTGNKNFGLFSTSITENSDQLNMYLTIYIIITTTNIIVGASRFAVLYYGSLKASKNLYQDLLKRILHAPMRYFDTTPIGRILNRFSKDFEFIDSGVPNDLMYFLIQWIIMISAVLTVCFVLPAFIIPMAVVTFLNIMVGKRFTAASRELRRMDSVTRSPLFTHFGETLVGAATIRAYGVTRQFMNEFLRRVDTNSRPFYYVWIANRWVGVRFSFLGAAVNFCTGVFILLSLNYMDASLAGFCLSFVLTYTSQMTMAIKRYTRLEMSFNAVERIVELMEIEQEPPAITNLRPPTEWPLEGKIEVKDLEVRYAPDLDPVLKGLTFSIKAKEKIGVVGRTGSGKSTLALSFFRFVEPSAGTIFIDGIDICQIGTKDLRSNLTIIPQDPILFSGSLRSNLDPFDEFDDDDILAALRRVELIPSEDDVDVPEASDQHSHEELNANIFTDLETPVSEGGLNFSQGQRQLICLARALLKRNRIVFMDEATASVDFETDEAIQKTIASEFADCTILCIAHRLRTIMEYDKILVLDQGEIIEFANPLELLNIPDSIFNKMCENSGEYETLVALAKRKHQLVDVL